MTAPKAAADPKPVFMKCTNPKCDSIQVVEVAYAPGTRLYRCVKCNTSRTVRVGGKMDMQHL
jgi:ribosomal protein S27E